MKDAVNSGYLDVGGARMTCALLGRDGAHRHRERHATAGRADLAAEHLDLPAALGNDVRAGALAEARLGAGRGADNVLLVEGAP